MTNNLGLASDAVVTSAFKNKFEFALSRPEQKQGQMRGYNQVLY